MYKCAPLGSLRPLCPRFSCTGHVWTEYTCCRLDLRGAAIWLDQFLSVFPGTVLRA